MMLDDCSQGDTLFRISKSNRTENAFRGALGRSGDLFIALRRHDSASDCEKFLGWRS